MENALNDLRILLQISVDYPIYVALQCGHKETVYESVTRSLEFATNLVQRIVFTRGNFHRQERIDSAILHTFIAENVVAIQTNLSFFALIGNADGIQILICRGGGSDGSI